MKKLLVTLMICTTLIAMPTKQSHAVIWVVLKAAIKKVVNAIDLQIQRKQNKVIWLQNAQKVLENTMSKLKLKEISGWMEKQKKLYQEYYEELAKVKAIITYYQRIKEVTRKQLRLVEAYKRAWELFQNDKHFGPAELDYMAKVYSGILEESVQNLDRIYLVLNSFQTKMTDAKRLEIINAAADRIDDNYDDLNRFNRQNFVLSLQRAKASNDIEVMKKLYGLKP